MRKCISLLLTLMMLLTAAPAAAGAESGAGVGWSDGEEGFAVRIMSYGGDVSRVTAGETFSVQFWIKQSNPAVVSVPLRWNPSVVTVVDASTGEPVKTGRKTEADLVRGAGFRPGETCYDNSLNDDYEPLYWNGKPVYAEGDGTEASGYPYINNETGFAKFLYYVAVPSKGSEPQMFLEVYFKSLAAGEPGLGFATAASGGGWATFDPGSPKGMQVSFSDPGEGNIDDMDEGKSLVYTGKVSFPSFRVTDGSELDKQPVVPPAGGSGSGGSGGGGQDAATTAPPVTEEPDPPVEAVMKPAVRPDRWPYDKPAAECVARIHRTDETKIYQSDEYVLLESELYEASARAAAASASGAGASSAAGSGGSGGTSGTSSASSAGTKAAAEKAILALMPEEIIDKAEYAVSLPTAPVLAMGEAGVDVFYLETPYGYAGVDIEAVSEKLKGKTVLRISVFETGKKAAGDSNAGAAKAGDFNAGGQLSGLSVSIQIDGAEATGFDKPALRLLLPYEAQSEAALPVVFTDRPFGYAGISAPLSVCRYDGKLRLLLVQSPAGGNLTIGESRPLVFSDLQSVPWAAADIGRLSQRNIVSGTGGGEFSPGDNVTREQFAKMVTAALGLYEANPKMPFKDIARSNPFYFYIASANARGIVSGVAAETFDGASRISRQDLAVVAYRACGAAGLSLPETTAAPVFSDDNTIEGYAKDAVYALARAGIISGVGEGRFDPRGSATRAEAARILGAIYELTDQLL